MDKDNFEKYILLGIEGKISVRKYIECEILIILSSLPLIVVERHNYIFLLLCLSPIILYSIFIIKEGKGKPIEGMYFILHNGIFSISFSLVLGMTGMGILIYLYSGIKKYIFICIVCLGYVLMSILCISIIKKEKRKKEDTSLKHTGKSISFILCGVLGGIVARIFLRDMSNQKAIEILCILCFLISYLTSIGVLNIYKFRYLIKHPEILSTYQLKNKGRH